jgi:hypothetical protein
LSDAQLLPTEGLGHNRLLAAPVVTKAISRFIEGERIVPLVASVDHAQATSA